MCHRIIIDPRGRPTVTDGRDHCFCTCRLFVRPSVRPSVHPHFSKQNKFQTKTMFTTGETVGLAEWIIDDTCLIMYCICFLNIKILIVSYNCLIMLIGNLGFSKLLLLDYFIGFSGGLLWLWNTKKANL